MPREQDHYTRQAKREGYPARSVYKLKEIDDKFRILPRDGRILDIGASPGSWSMYVTRKSKAHVVGVDIQDQKPKLPEKAFTFIQGDAFEDKIRDRIAELGPYTCFLSDAAPSTTGNRMVDTARSSNLVEQCIDLASRVLKPGGNFVAKLFQGGDERELVDALRKYYGEVKTYKPKSSRKQSFEVFLVAKRFHGKKP